MQISRTYQAARSADANNAALQDVCEPVYEPIFEENGMNLSRVACLAVAIPMFFAASAVSGLARAQSGRGTPPQDTTEVRKMIASIVTFKFPAPRSVSEMTEVFKSTAPKYQSVKGLLRKNYWVSEDGREGGGIYVWASRADADALYTTDWKKNVESKYGAPPAIVFIHSPVMVDNLAQRITIDP
jgi:hypothetical protein